jgi:hypothetical protein
MACAAHLLASKASCLLNIDIDSRLPIPDGVTSDFVSGASSTICASSGGMAAESRILLLSP